MRFIKSHSWLLVVMVTFCTLLMTIIFFSALGDKGIGVIGKIILLTFAATGICAVIIAGGRIVEPGKGVSGIFTPKAASLVLVAVMAVFGTLSDLYGLLSPRAATESAAGQIERNTAEILEIVRPSQEEPPRVLSELSGLWGEPGCGVVHRFSIEGDAVVVEEIGNDYRSVGTIISASGDEMRTTTVEPPEDRGTSMRLIYETNGVTETLTIADLRTEVPLTLDRCE